MKTIVVKNTGIMNLPKGTYLRAEGSKLKVDMPLIEVNKEWLFMVRIVNTKNQVGKYEQKY